MNREFVKPQSWNALLRWLMRHNPSASSPMGMVASVWRPQPIILTENLECIDYVNAESTQWIYSIISQS